MRQLTPTGRKSVPTAPSLRPRTGYFNLIAHTLHSELKLINGSPGVASGALHRLEGHTDRFAPTQPGQDFVAEPAELDTDRNPTQGYQSEETISSERRPQKEDC